MDILIYCGMDVLENSFTLCFATPVSALGKMEYSKPVKIEPTADMIEKA